MTLVLRLSDVVRLPLVRLRVLRSSLFRRSCCAAFAYGACRLALHQHGLDRFIAQMAELHLTVQIIAHVFDDHEEAHDEQNPDDPRGQYHHFLSVGEREHAARVPT